MGLFKQNKNKRFNYTPRRLKEQDSHIKEQFESKRRDTKHVSKNKRNASSSLLVFILILGMIIALFYILDNYKN